MKDKIVCIEWDDASYDSGYYDKNKASTFDPIASRSVGHLIKSSRLCVILSAERFYDKDGNLESQRHIFTIPKKMIRKITYLRGE